MFVTLEFFYSLLIVLVLTLWMTVSVQVNAIDDIMISFVRNKINYITQNYEEHLNFFQLIVTLKL
jgi:vacuolar-type H+-ATPase subunit D/Vma8